MDGQFVTSFGGFKHSRGIASNSRNGHIYVCDYEGNEIVELLLCDNRCTEKHMCTCACANSLWRLVQDVFNFPLICKV